MVRDAPEFTNYRAALRADLLGAPHHEDAGADMPPERYWLAQTMRAIHKTSLVDSVRSG
jgi:hypothetical protein